MMTMARAVRVVRKDPTVSGRTRMKFTYHFVFGYVTGRRATATFLISYIISTIFEKRNPLTLSQQKIWDRVIEKYSKLVCCYSQRNA